ncbi:MAG: DUF2783 domain-containing protein [Burkholderiaceae bacterium]
MVLITAPHLESPDDFYAALIDAHRDLTSDESHALNARLVLLLANHIGALEVLRQALRVARAAPEGAAPSGDDSQLVEV